MFGRFKEHKSTIVRVGTDAVIAQPDPSSPPIIDVSGVVVDASCNQTITISCLQQLYNAVGVIPSAANNSIAVTAYSVRILLAPRNCVDLG